VIVYARRASALLFNLLRHRRDPRPFLLPANVCPIVPVTLLKAGQPFQLLDIDPADLGLDRVACRRHLEEDPEGYAGVLYVRPFGAVENLSPFLRSLRGIRPDLFIVDDRCLCPPDLDGTEIEPDADATLYSTGRAKPVDIGWGGFAHLRRGVGYSEAALGFELDALEAVEAAYKAAVTERRPFEGDGGDWLDTRQPEVVWEDYRQAALQQRRLVADQRERLNRIYARGLPDSIQLPERFHGWRFQVRMPHPQELLEHLKAEGLFASRHYASLGRGIFADGAFIHAEALAEEIVNLFNDHRYTQTQAVRTVEVILDHLLHCDV
jgi:hypothetical protein